MPTPTNTPELNTVLFQVRVADGKDDAEEVISSGKVRVSNSDLELVEDGSDQVIGIRFINVNVPRNASIVQAHIEFEADETDGESTNLTFYTEASDNPARFSWC